MAATVLIVEDEKPQRTFYADILGASGFRCIAAASGEEALGKVAKTEPDVALVDMRMPGMDGLALLQALRQRLSRMVPAVILTGLSPMEIRRKVAAAGFGRVEIIEKDGNLDGVIERLKELSQTDPGDPPVLKGIVAVDPGVRRAWIRGREIHLSPLSFDVLCILLQSPGPLCLETLFCCLSDRERVIEELRPELEHLKHDLEVLGIELKSSPDGYSLGLPDMKA